MVRLKAGQIGNRWEAYGISIPYGAIKRLPYIISKIQKPLFQFLMVRLKDQKDYFIDILLKQFQFLMVRLKGN
mgnify:CR=1 FL=1